MFDHTSGHMSSSLDILCIFLDSATQTTSMYCSGIRRVFLEVHNFLSFLNMMSVKVPEILQKLFFASIVSCWRRSVRSDFFDLLGSLPNLIGCANF